MNTPNSDNRSDFSRRDVLKKLALGFAGASLPLGKAFPEEFTFPEYKDRSEMTFDERVARVPAELWVDFSTEKVARGELAPETLPLLVHFGRYQLEHPEVNPKDIAFMYEKTQDHFRKLRQEAMDAGRQFEVPDAVISGGNFIDAAGKALPQFIPTTDPVTQATYVAIMRPFLQSSASAAKAVTDGMVFGSDVAETLFGEEKRLSRQLEASAQYAAGIQVYGGLTTSQAARELTRIQGLHNIDFINDSLIRDKHFSPSNTAQMNELTKTYLSKNEVMGGMREIFEAVTQGNNQTKNYFDAIKENLTRIPEIERKVTEMEKNLTKHIDTKAAEITKKLGDKIDESTNTISNAIVQQGDRIINYHEEKERQQQQAQDRAQMQRELFDNVRLLSMFCGEEVQKNAGKVLVCADALMKSYSAFQKFALSDGKAFATGLLTGNLVNIGLNLITTLGSEQQSEYQPMLDSLARIEEQLRTIQESIQRIEEKLGEIHADIHKGFNQVLSGIRDLKAGQVVMDSRLQSLNQTVGNVENMIRDMRHDTRDLILSTEARQFRDRFDDLMNWREENREMLMSEMELLRLVAPLLHDLSDRGIKFAASKDHLDLGAYSDKPYISAADFLDRVSRYPLRQNADFLFSYLQKEHKGAFELQLVGKDKVIRDQALWARSAEMFLDLLEMFPAVKALITSKTAEDLRAAGQRTLETMEGLKFSKKEDNTKSYNPALPYRMWQAYFAKLVSFDFKISSAVSQAAKHSLQGTSYDGFRKGPVSLLGHPIRNAPATGRIHQIDNKAAHFKLSIKNALLKPISGDIILDQLLTSLEGDLGRYVSSALPAGSLSLSYDFRWTNFVQKDGRYKKTFVSVFDAQLEFVVTGRTIDNGEPIEVFTASYVFPARQIETVPYKLKQFKTQFLIPDVKEAVEFANKDKLETVTADLKLWKTIRALTAKDMKIEFADATIRAMAQEETLKVLAFEREICAAVTAAANCETFTPKMLDSTKFDALKTTIEEVDVAKKALHFYYELAMPGFLEYNPFITSALVGSDTLPDRKYLAARANNLAAFLQQETWFIERAQVLEAIRGKPKYDVTDDEREYYRLNLQEVDKGESRPLSEIRDPKIPTIDKFDIRSFIKSAGSADGIMHTVSALQDVMTHEESRALLGSDGLGPFTTETVTQLNLALASGIPGEKEGQIYVVDSQLSQEQRESDPENQFKLITVKKYPVEKIENYERLKNLVARLTEAVKDINSAAK